MSSKTNAKKNSFGEGLEEAIRLAFAWMDDDRAMDLSSEVDWAPSEARSEAEYVDSLVKKMAFGVPKEQLWRDAGYSPTQIGRFKSMLMEEGLRTDVFGQAPPSPAPALDPNSPDLNQPVMPDVPIS